LLANSSPVIVAVTTLTECWGGDGDDDGWRVRRLGTPKHRPAALYSTRIGRPAYSPATGNETLGSVYVLIAEPRWRM